MGTRMWKITVVALVLLIVGIFAFIQGFHYEVIEGSTFPSGSPQNGTLIVVESLPNVNVKVNASFSFTGTTDGHGVIFLENGTSYTVNNSHQNVFISETITGKWFSYSAVGGFPFGVNLSSANNPFAIAVVQNFPHSDFNSQYLAS